MDIVLELTDTFIADYVYAYLYPIHSDITNETTVNTSAQALSPWFWEPATKYFHIQPSPAAYMSSLTRDNPYRQLATLFFITWIFGTLVYFIFATLSYYLIFDKRTLNHPKFLKHQVWLEIKQTIEAMPLMTIFTVPLFFLEIRGFGQLYDTTADGPGIWYNILQFPFFLIFTDFCIYWIHRYLHHPFIYKHLHKYHHKWIVPTPYASHAFHPLDGFAQSLPYHIFPFILPLQKVAYVVLFVFINFWSILIHDVNFGQFFTAFDRLGGTYRMPDAWMFVNKIKMSAAQWQKESMIVDGFVKQIEGNDDRIYSFNETKAKIE